jgi:mycothiol synthase
MTLPSAREAHTDEPLCQSRGVLPTGLRARPAQAGDLPAIGAMITDRMAALWGAADDEAADLAEWWRRPNFDPATATWLLETEHGAVAGYAHAWARTPAAVFTALHVAPAWRDRGLDAYLMACLNRWRRQTQAQAQAAGAPVVASYWCPGSDQSLRHLLEAYGYRPARRFDKMTVTLQAPPAPPEPPHGIQIRPLLPGVEDRIAYDLWNESFADHWNHTGTPYEEWHANTIGAAAFEPRASFLALAEGRPVALALGRLYPDSGWIEKLGVIRPWRRRGIAGTLVQAALSAFYALGRTQVGLMVDADSATGAPSVYRRAGLATAKYHVIYRLEGVQI